MKQRGKYYLGLDVGTDSVGYAVTAGDYTLLKFRGEPMWGSHLFEQGLEAAERRVHRSNRRRIDRRQQRVELTKELFAEEIGKIDSDFFIRRKESALFPEDTSRGTGLFRGPGITDEEYHRRYPTIHHLIVELMVSDEPHDVRLVYIACAWLVAHRGHFLFDMDGSETGELLDFQKTYREFCDYLTEHDWSLPWDGTVKPEQILSIMQLQVGINKKKEAFREVLCRGKKISKEPTESFPFSAEGVVGLLAGAVVKPEALFCSDAYEQMDAVSLQMDDEDFDRALSELGEDGELLIMLRRVYNCAKLISAMTCCRKGDPRCISSAKAAVYEQHRKDLATLKRIVKKYCPKLYPEIFRRVSPGNYVAYSGNVRSCKKAREVKRTDKIGFSDYLKKKLKGLKVDPVDQADYEDMMNRLESCSFLPKQRDTDNRVIPQQLYRQELVALLKKAEGYLPMLSRRDDEGMTVSEKLVSVFDFRIPYYVGPLVRNPGSTAWIERKKGRILPWNFEDMVDLDASEQAFIKKMTNCCAYLPGEDVLPVNSLLYEKFTVLNALNNLKVNGHGIPVEVKQELYAVLFLGKQKVTARDLENHLRQHGHMGKDDELTGVDSTFRAGLGSRWIFRRMLNNGILSEDDAERIIHHAAYTEDRSRMRRWLRENYPQMSEADGDHILRQKLKGFGRLSACFLDGIRGKERDSDKEPFTIIQAMWNTNSNLMQLLSDKCTFGEQIDAYRAEYYSGHPQKLSDRLSEMYVSNAAKRPVFRTMDIVSDVVKAAGGAPQKIFLEMARGGSPDQKGKRTQSRTKQLLELYRKIRTEEGVRFAGELAAMGAAADSRLQDRKLYLYYLQLGKCAYTGRSIDLSRLADGTYNLEHIYPQSMVKDDSILNNLVLVESEVNGQKQDVYPVDRKIRDSQKGFWRMLKENGLMTEEKYRRLTRSTPFTAEEKLGFINRQLVETRQSTKVLAALLQERFPDTEIVYVKAGLVSEFRQEFGMLKCRAVNDLHHAKDAYLNIVVGNVYHERFTRKWFSVDEHYNVQVKKLFSKRQYHGQEIYWNGEGDVARVRKTVEKNAAHLTRYTFFRKGGLFDQQPKKAAEGLVPLKKGLSTQRYGGYNKATASCFLLVRFKRKGKGEAMLVPVELMVMDRVLCDRDYAQQYITNAVEKITGKVPEEPEILLGGRPLKINTVFSFDGSKMALAGKSSGGRQILMSPLTALVLPPEWERYAKRLESFHNKRLVNKNLLPDEARDGISRERNVALYQILTEKMGAWPFAQFPGNQADTLLKGRDCFAGAEITGQVECLMNILLMMGPGGTAVDLSGCGGKKTAGSKLLSSCLSNWKKRYSDVRIIDESASGLFSKSGGNLLELL